MIKYNKMMIYMMMIALKMIHCKVCILNNKQNLNIIYFLISKIIKYKYLYPIISKL
jgi:hypothetical protein